MANTALKYAGALALGVMVGLPASDAQAKTVFLYGFPHISPPFMSKDVNGNVSVVSKAGGEIVPPASDSGVIASYSVPSLALFAMAMVDDNFDTVEDVPAVSRIAPFAVPIVPIPVPAALPILAAALAGFGLAGWHRQRNAG